jgi:hypothetical protein
VGRFDGDPRAAVAYQIMTHQILLADLSELTMNIFAVAQALI